VKKSLSAPVGCLAIIILLLTLRTQPALAATRADEQTFITLQRDWAKARKNADMQFLDRFYAREFTVGVMNGASLPERRIWRCFCPAT
jgi:hypothetical protein